MDEAMIVRAMGCLACAAAAVCMPILAHGEGQPDDGPFAVALEYSAAPGCADENDFKAIVVGRLGYDAFRADARDRVLVDIASRGNSFEGHIERRNAEGRWAGDRTFPSRSDDCLQLGRAMAFALALQIQLSAKASASPSSNKTPGPTETTSTPTSPAPAPLASVPAPNVQEVPPTQANEPAAPNRVTRPTLNMGAGGLLGFGLSSTAVPLGRVFGSVAWQHSSLELAGELGWPKTTRREDGAGFSQQPLLIGVAGCGDLQPWSACILAKMGAIRIVGEGIDHSRSPWAPLLETGLRLALQQRLGRRLFVAARAEGAINLTRWRIALDNNPVWSAPRFAATLGLDLGVRFLQALPSEGATSQNAGERDE